MPTLRKDRAAFVAVLVAFGAWTAAVLTPTLAAADLAITRWLQQDASPTLDALLSLVTILGNFEITVVLVAIMGVVLIRRGQAAFAVALWAAFLAGSGVEWVTKQWLPHAGVPLSLQRPHLNVFHHYVETPYSYMSGHAFRTLLLATVASWMGTRFQPGALVLRYLLRALVVLIGIALVYLGDHWTSEVVGGYLWASVWVVLLRAQQRWPAIAPTSGQHDAR